MIQSYLNSHRAQHPKRSASTRQDSLPDPGQADCVFKPDSPGRTLPIEIEACRHCLGCFRRKPDDPPGRLGYRSVTGMSVKISGRISRINRVYADAILRQRVGKCHRNAI